ncbi:MAG: YggS family pyridoxal phosphate-dependent enzyme [Buchnera aphidicola (Floraphis choui)]
MSIIQKKINAIKNKIISINNKYCIAPKKIKLLIVSKSRSILDIKKAMLYKQYNFGESYIQESLLKINKLKNVQWHFIGNVQSNKTQIISTNFSWCHTIKTEKTARLLDKYRTNILPKLNVLIQIDIRNNFIASKENINHFKNLVKKIISLKNLNLRGIMGMPYKFYCYNDQIQSYKHIKLYFSIIKDIYPNVDTISIGTSNDIKAAIISGSTLLRIGSYIFN